MGKRLTSAYWHQPSHHNKSNACLCYSGKGYSMLVDKFSTHVLSTHRWCCSQRTFNSTDKTTRRFLRDSWNGIMFQRWFWLIEVWGMKVPILDCAYDETTIIHLIIHP
eukprot:scaffold2661_cov65-Cylindrotheca_fusiformis.AAC.2